MTKLFEIPIYGMSRKELTIRYQNARDKIQEKYPDLSADRLEFIDEYETYPQRSWEYNHLVGYIVIYHDRNDVFYDIYLPYKSKKYYWKSYRKIFLYNVRANGTHFRVDEPIDNKTIQKELLKLLDFVIKEHIPKHYFVDREVFDNTYLYINYSEIMINE